MLHLFLHRHSLYLRGFWAAAVGIVIGKDLDTALSPPIEIIRITQDGPSTHARPGSPFLLLKYLWLVGLSAHPKLCSLHIPRLDVRFQQQAQKCITQNQSMFEVVKTQNSLGFEFEHLSLVAC